MKKMTFHLTFINKYIHKRKKKEKLNQRKMNNTWR